ncbi:MAG: bifunctional folylpolyglutamate synthase/dihydrofolate synthase [Bacteroidales bacterium]|nr:bifunctional folylpolyglutamate synthase/dihydrofolate synthase [Bacteroidales bacterium]
MAEETSNPIITDYSEEKYNLMLEGIFVRYPSVQTNTFSKAYKPGLQHMVDFCSVLGDPHKAYPTVHVAGTNGKGSVSNMIAASLMEVGYHVGLYTSPHITDFRERMRVDGKMVPKEWVYDFMVKNSDTFAKLELSFFEITTGMAFAWFAEQKVDIAIIEVGLGGLLDSTNIIRPLLSIVTSIGLDHCDLLGNTLAEIASQKAGIFKDGVPALVGEVLPETRPVFEKTASEKGCQLYYAESTEPTLWNNRSMILSRMDLRGTYQEKNLRTVLCALDILKEKFPALEDTKKVIHGIVDTASIMDFHGRWERICDSPLVICDIGHNAHALRNNFSQLATMLSNEECSSLIIVYAVMADKDFDSIMPLMPLDATYIFTTPNTRRALPASEILAKYTAYRKSKGLPVTRLYSVDSVRNAVSMAVELASNIKKMDSGSRVVQPVIYVGGSTFAVAEAVPLLRKK